MTNIHEIDGSLMLAEARRPVNAPGDESTGPNQTRPVKGAEIALEGRSSWPKAFQPVFNRRCLIAGGFIPGGVAAGDTWPGYPDELTMFIIA
jgi:hypothetical protein